MRLIVSRAAAAAVRKLKTVPVLRGTMSQNSRIQDCAMAKERMWSTQARVDMASQTNLTGSEDRNSAPQGADVCSRDGRVTPPGLQHEDTTIAHTWPTSEWVKRTLGAREIGASLGGDTLGCRGVHSLSLRVGCEDGPGRQDPRPQVNTQESSRVDPKLRTLVAALKACSSSQDLESAKQLHMEAVKSGYESNVYVGTMMVDVCCKCGSLVDARQVFEKMPRRNVITWNAIILGYAQMQAGEEALQLYNRMRHEGVVPNDRTFVSVLKACSSLVVSGQENGADANRVRQKCLERVRRIHADAVKGGSDSSVFVGTMLVDAYAKCASLVDARSVFDKLCSRDVVSWNAMILGYAQREMGQEALQMYARMHKEGGVPNDRTFVGALKAVASVATLAADGNNMVDGAIVRTQCLEQVRAIHKQIAKGGYESDMFVGNMLTDVYAKCGRLEDARNVFDKMPRRNVVSWTAMILAYAQMDLGEEALHLYREMQEEGIVPNDRTFVGALRACTSLGGVGEEKDSTVVRNECLELVRDIHVRIVKGGFDLTACLGTMLVEVYSKCGTIVDARSVFDKMFHHDAVSVNAMILGYVQVGDGEEALKLYRKMQEEGLTPNDRTFVGALKACSTLAAPAEHISAEDGVQRRQRCLDLVRDIHSQVSRSAYGSDLFVGNMLIDVYAKCRSLSDARSVFEAMVHRDVVSWNSIILAHVQMEEGPKALHLYTQMQHEGVEPDERTFVVALQACGSVAGLGKGKEIHAQILESGIESPNAFIANSLIDMYGKCGCMVSAQQVFNSLATRDVVTWNALIAAYGRQGESTLLFRLFEDMKQQGVQPDSITFLSLLTVCTHVGLVDEGQKYFFAMSSEYGINPTMEHLICMVDLLGRAGRLEEAMEMVRNIPSKVPIEVWRCMLGNCQKWNNVELARQAFDCANSTDQMDAASYALMSNIYAAADMWADVKKIQAVRIKARAWKQPGQSWWTDTSGMVHAFVVGERRHEGMRHVSAELRQLSIKLKEGCDSDKAIERVSVY